MRILIGCEESQTLCIRLRKMGHETYSCDIKSPTGGHAEWHIKGDIFEAIERGCPTGGDWDVLIVHFPCTYLTVTGNAWLKDQKPRKSGKLVGEKRRQAVKDAIEFAKKCWNCKIKKIAMENPVGVFNSIMPPTQIIQPYFFGDADKKRTCLWLKGFPPLQHFDQDDLFATKTHVEPIPIYIRKDGTGIFFTDAISGTGINAASLRSKTFKGIADAMCSQWFEDLMFDDLSWMD